MTNLIEPSGSLPRAAARNGAASLHPYVSATSDAVSGRATGDGIAGSSLLAACVTVLLFLVLWMLAGASRAEADPQGVTSGAASFARGPLSDQFAAQVRPQLALPDASLLMYRVQLDAALASVHAELPAPKFIVLVDRNVQVQAAILFWGSPATGWRFIGAAPVSTGLPGKFEHFLTPLGVFEHTRENPDFRASGTKNQFGIRGYGGKGSRVYDFGWVASARGWGDHAAGQLRFQMHSTDADRLAQRLGTAQSEGCVRIPAALNEFIDRYGILDEDYDRAVANGGHLWLLRADRAPTAWSGRFLVVIESPASTRPEWAALVPVSRR